MKQSRVSALLSAPKKAPKKAQTFSIAEDVAEAFKDLCTERGISPSDLVEALIEDTLERYKRAPKKAEGPKA